MRSLNFHFKCLVILTIIKSYQKTAKNGASKKICEVSLKFIYKLFVLKYKMNFLLYRYRLLKHDPKKPLNSFWMHLIMLRLVGLWGPDNSRWTRIYWKYGNFCFMFWVLFFLITQFLLFISVTSVSVSNSKLSKNRLNSSKNCRRLRTPYSSS